MSPAALKRALDPAYIGSPFAQPFQFFDGDVSTPMDLTGRAVVLFLDKQGWPDAHHEITGVIQTEGRVLFSAADTSAWIKGDYSLEARLDGVSVVVGRIVVAKGAGASGSDMVGAAQPPTAPGVVIAGSGVVQVVSVAPSAATDPSAIILAPDLSAALGGAETLADALLWLAQNGGTPSPILRDLIGGVVISSVATGALSVAAAGQVLLSGAISSASSATGSLTVGAASSIALVGTAVSTSSLTGAMTVVTQIALAGGVVGSSALSGTMTVATDVIGGLAIGTAGAGIQSGYSLVGGDDYGGALDAITPAVPFGKYGTTRAYLLPTAANGPRGAVGGLSLKHYNVDPAHTGYNDKNRGVARASWADSIVQSASVLKLKARTASSDERALFNPDLNVNNIASMIHTAGSLVFRAPFFIEWRAKLTKAQSAMGGFHPSLWLMQMDPPRSGNGLEIDWEGESFRIETNYFVWSGGGSTPSKDGQVTTVYDNQFHDFALEVTPTTLRWYYDGALIREAAYSMAFPDKPFYALMTSHVSNFGTDPYVDAQWVAAGAPGAAIELDWFRLWTQPASPARVPSLAPVNYEVASGAPFSFTLPTSTEVWGSEISEKVEGFISESNSPGGNYSGAFSGWPTGISYNATTRVLSGASTEPGTLHIVRYPVDGGSAQPHRSALHVGPKLVTASWPGAVIGVPYSYDLYSVCDCGQLTSDGSGARATTIGVTSLPDGLAYNDVTGLVTGTPTTVQTVSPSVSITNSRGQSAVTTASLTVAASAGGAFVQDTFTQASLTPLASHTGEVGATWTAVPTMTINDLRVSSSGRLYNTTTFANYGRASGTPPNANYYVEGVITFLPVISGDAGAGIAGRVSATVQTLYFTRYSESAGAWQLYSIVNGTTVLLASFVAARPSTDATVRLTMNSSTISVSVNGTQVISVTNSAITAAGHAGVRYFSAQTATTGQHMSSIMAVPL